MEPPLIFALNASRDFGEAVASALGTRLSAHEEREFEDGEHKSRPRVNVRDRDVFVIQSLYADPRQSVNDKLVRLLFFLGALRDASAARLTAVVPYLAYARKDARTQVRDPVSTRYVAQLIESVGTDRVVTLEVHNLAAFQNALRIRAEHLEATKLFVAHFAPLLQNEPDITVVSPDIGGMKRAERFRQALGRALGREPAIAFFEKARARGQMRTGRLVGEVTGTAVILDDLISTGGTLKNAAVACREQGATRVYAAATHGVFAGTAARLFTGTAPDQVIVTDTVAPQRLDPQEVRGRLTVLSAAPLFAEAIRRIHTGGSLAELLES
jgi:ribose-phosphate pyrophosphokinase